PRDLFASALRATWTGSFFAACDEALASAGVDVCGAARWASAQEVASPREQPICQSCSARSSLSAEQARCRQLLPSPAAQALSRISPASSAFELVPSPSS